MKKLTLVHDRFQVVCACCGLVSAHTTREEALKAARLHPVRHACNSVVIYDCMARKKAQP